MATIALGSSAARADMASAYAGTVTSSAQVSNASDATGMENSTCATTTGVPASILLTNFGFALPAGASVQGIMVEAKVGYLSSAQSGSFTVSLTANGGGSYASTSIALPGDGVVANCGETTFKSAGDSTETWGSSWGAASINSANFGVRLLGFEGRFIDAVKVTVYYTPMATPTDTRTPSATTTATATATQTGTATSTGTATQSATATGTGTATASATPSATPSVTPADTATPTATPIAPRLTGGVEPGATRVSGRGEPNLPDGALLICLAGPNGVFEDCGGDDVVIGSGHTDAAGAFAASPGGIPVAPPIQAGDLVCAYDTVHDLGSCELATGPAPVPALDRTPLLGALALLVTLALWRLRAAAGDS